MAGVTGGLMSLGASGTLAKTLTYSRWKGIPYVRTRVIPANPQSTSQTQTRDVFAYLFALFKVLPSIGREPWVAAVIGRPMTPANMLLSKNIANIRTQTDLDLLDMSPGSGGGVPPDAMTATPGTGQITVAVTAPTPPAGWTLVGAQALALIDQDPHVALVDPPKAGQDLTAPFSIVITGLTASSPYQVGAWLKWTTSTGNTAYSTALRTQATPT